jgi:hypothetical protein
MNVVKTVRLARRIHKFERARGMKVAQQLEALSDNTFLARATNPERVLFITPKGEAEGRRLVYNKKRNIVQ